MPQEASDWEPYGPSVKQRVEKRPSGELAALMYKLLVNPVRRRIPPDPRPKTHQTVRIWLISPRLLGSLRRHCNGDS